MNNKIDTILDSLQGIQRATPGPFFFTRVSARLQREQKNTWQNLARLVTRPAIAVTGLCLVLLINIWVVVTRSEDTVTGQRSEIVLADEYSVTSNSLYNY